MDKSYWVYIVTDKAYGTLCTGVTNNIIRRSSEHKKGQYVGFTQKYGLKKLVYYENYQWVEDAIRREKSIKKWKRLWKIDLIQKFNPEWKDLGEVLHQ